VARRRRYQRSAADLNVDRAGVGAVLTGATGLGSAQMAQLARDLHRMGPAGRRSLRKRMADLSGPLLADARGRASWSTRIPGAISVRPVLRDNLIGVQLRVDAKKAPHARPFEGLVRPRSFKHPVFGDRDADWVTQTTRPFAGPAVDAKARATKAAVLGAYEDAAREAGFR
jgi:hypothetical protein